MRLVLWIVVVLGIMGAVAAAVTMLGIRSFERRVQQEMESLLGNAERTGDGVILEDDLAGLPAPVQRYLRFAGVVGRPPIHAAFVTQEGGFRTSPEQQWMPFTAQETYTTEPPGFIWQARISIFSLPVLTVRDHYRDGEGRVQARLGGLVAVADDRADEASLMRYFNELMWMPTAYLAGNVQWETVDDSHARATISDRDMTATALFTFGEEGQIDNFAADRLSSVTGDIERWETPIDEWGEFEGYRVPLHGMGVWKLEDGDFAYIDLRIVDVAYDVDVP